MPAALLTLAGWQFLELEQREKAPPVSSGPLTPSCARAQDASRHPPEVICGTVFENVAALLGPLLLIVLPRDASRACHSDASCNATEHALFIVPYQGFSWCYVQVVVPMWH